MWPDETFGRYAWRPDAADSVAAMAGSPAPERQGLVIRIGLMKSTGSARQAKSLIPSKFGRQPKSGSILGTSRVSSQETGPLFAAGSGEVGGALIFLNTSREHDRRNRREGESPRTDRARRAGQGARAAASRQGTVRISRGRPGRGPRPVIWLLDRAGPRVQKRCRST